MKLMSNVVTNDKEAFEYVKMMLLDQNEQSKDLSDNCQYRGYSHDLIAKLKDKAEDIFLEEESPDDSVSYLEWECGILDDLIANESPDLKCAAGWLINDSFYHQNFEGEMVHQNNSIWMSIKRSNPLWFTNNNSLKLVTELQNIHDSRSEEEWFEKFNELEPYFNAYGDYIPKVESEQ
jgi:hypothetical protein